MFSGGSRSPTLQVRGDTNVRFCMFDIIYFPGIHCAHPVGKCSHNHINKQECIPVGCVPPTHWLYFIVCAGGMCAAHPPPCMHPCHACPPPPHIPLPYMPPAMHTSLPCMPPATYPPSPCGQNSWHSLLKILPCPNFVAGGNYIIARCTEVYEESLTSSNILQEHQTILTIRQKILTWFHNSGQWGNYIF